jgi:hypothetical protein
MTAQQPFHYFFGRTRGLPVPLVGLVAFANHRQNPLRSPKSDRKNLQPINQIGMALTTTGSTSIWFSFKGSMLERTALVAPGLHLVALVTQADSALLPRQVADRHYE